MNPKSVLIIDDEELIRKTVSSALTRRNFNVTTASNGEEGLARAIELKPDVIVCDSRMPKLSGAQVIEALKRNPATAHIPVVMMSGSESRETAGQADDFIAKPFVLDQLISAINRVLGAKE